MYTHKMYSNERIQPSHELSRNEDLELRNHPLQIFAVQQPWNMATMVEPSVIGLRHDNFGHAKSASATMLSRFESPASAFCAAERYMGFQQYGCDVGDSPDCYQSSKACDMEFPLYRPSRESFSINLHKQSDPMLEMKDTIPEIVNLKFPCSNQHHRAAEKCHKVQYSNSLASKVLAHKQDKSLCDDTASVWSCVSIPSSEHKENKVSCSSSGHLLSELSVLPHSEKESSKASPLKNTSTGSALSNKTRIRWTQELHEKFVECVNRLGGAEKATPKAILKLMDSDGLTIFHIKSHLQKYRIAKYMPDSAEGKTSRRTSLNDVPPFYIKNGLQIKEALQLQLDVQRRLHEQLEIQRNLQMRIEEQGRQLRMLFDQQQKSSKESSKTESLNGLEDVHSFAAEGCENTHFPSKIS